LAKIAKYTGGQAAGLLSKDTVSKSGNIYYQSGVDPYFVKLYSETASALPSYHSPHINCMQ